MGVNFQTVFGAAQQAEPTAGGVRRSMSEPKKQARPNLGNSGKQEDDNEKNGGTYLSTVL